MFFEACDTVNVEIFAWGNFRVFRALVFFAKITPTRKTPLSLYEGNRSRIVKITPT